MKFLTFLLKSLARNRLRSALTGLSIATAVFILCILVTLVTAMNKLDGAGGDAARHIVVQEKYSFPSLMPLAYLDRVRAVPGVRTACPFYWWGGKGKVESDPPIFGPAVGADSIDPFLGGPMGRAETPAMVEAFKRDKQAILIGLKWHEKYGWNTGDTITLKGATVPVDLEFHVVGYVVDGSLDDNFLFRYDYINDTLAGLGRSGLADQVMSIYVDPAAGVDPGELAGRLDAVFAAGPVFTRTESEAAVLATFAATAGAMIKLLGVFGAAATLTLFLVVGNAVSMSVRERTLEIGVLKTLGFSRAGVIGLVAGEAALIALLSGVAGAGAAWGLTAVHPIDFPLTIVTRFVVGPGSALGAVVIAALVGLLSGLPPAWRASRLPVVEALRRLN